MMAEWLEWMWYAWAFVCNLFVVVGFFRRTMK